MPHERDERWVYVALAVLAVAFAVYAFRDSIDLSKLSFEWAKKLGGTASYGLATAFAVFFQLWNRKRVERARKKWEADVAVEGLLRKGSDLKVVFGGGARGSFSADVQLTRSAFYLFDRGGRREPTRLLLTPASPRDPAVSGATVDRAAAGGAGVVRIHIHGPSPFHLEFQTPDAEGWRTDIRSALGRPVRAGERRATDEPEEHEQE